MHLLITLLQGNEESPTSNYNSFENTFILCPTIISDKKADSAEECITRCYEDERCTHWTWCPDDEPGLVTDLQLRPFFLPTY